MSEPLDDRLSRNQPRSRLRALAEAMETACEELDAELSEIVTSGPIAAVESDRPYLDDMIDTLGRLGDAVEMLHAIIRRQRHVLVTQRASIE